MMRSNPFVPLYDRINAGDSAYKFRNLPDFPVMLDVELTNRCNFRCLMCKTGTGDIKRKSGFMSDETYHLVLEAVAPHCTPLRFIRWGEPTLHPRWREYMRMAKQAGCLVHFNTNGSLLNEAGMRDILDIGVDSIKFSFQGVDASSYREVRNIDFFDKLVEKIRLLHSLRGTRLHPYIQVNTTVTDENPGMIERFIALMEPITDHVGVSKTLMAYIGNDLASLTRDENERIRELKAREIIPLEHPDCPEVFGKLSINWDGSVSACCRDYDNLMLCGDLYQHSLSEIWNSKKMSIYRKELMNMNYDKFTLCRLCF